MSLAQARSAAMDGLNVTQSGMALIAANVANSGTPGYTAKPQTLDPLTVGGANVGVDVVGVNRQLDTFLQNQLRTESSGGAFADLTSQIYQQLQQAYGSPSSTTSLQATYSTFTGALQSLASNPSDYPTQTGVINAAATLSSQLNGLTTSVQNLRSSCEQGLSDSVTAANRLLKSIADINAQVAGSPTQSAATASLLDQRDTDIDQLAKLMAIRVVPGSRDQVSIFTTTGVQLAGTVASSLAFNSHGTLSASSQWNINPNVSGVGTITLIDPTGGSVDLVAANVIKAGQIGAYLQMRDNILPQAQSQLDQVAASMSRALSDYQTNGTAVAVPLGQAGFDINVGNLLAGNTIKVSYTAAPGNTPRTLTIEQVNDPAALPLPSPDPNNQVIGVDFSGGVPGVLTQLNGIFNSKLQFSSPSSGTLRVLDGGAGTGIAINSVTSTATQTGLAGGMSQLPFFTDGVTAFSGAVTSGQTQTNGFAGRIAVNPALVANPSALVSFQPGIASGDPTRPTFLASQLTSANFTFSPQTGIGTPTSPYSGTLSSYIGQVLSTQGAAAASAKSLSDGQDVVVNSLQSSFNSASGVNIDNEMSNLLTLQSAYSANARVLTTVNQMFNTLLQAFAA
jgi:flagellar hook-associated protein 1 FlgK